MIAMDVGIREATMGDRDALSALFAQGDALHLRGAPDVFREHAGPARSEDFFRQVLDDPDAALLVAERGGRAAVFDVWDFDGDIYEITTYVIEDRGGDAVRTEAVRGGRYYCVEIPALEKLLAEAGFAKTAVLRDRFFQPLIVGVAGAI
jgi:hypothetical protein